MVFLVWFSEQSKRDFVLLENFWRRSSAFVAIRAGALVQEAGAQAMEQALIKLGDSTMPWEPSWHRWFSLSQATYAATDYPQTAAIESSIVSATTETPTAISFCTSWEFPRIFFAVASGREVSSPSWPFRSVLTSCLAGHSFYCSEQPESNSTRPPRYEMDQYHLCSINGAIHNSLNYHNSPENSLRSCSRWMKIYY